MTTDPFLAEAALAAIAAAPKALTRTDVAAALGTTGGDADGALRLLISDGLVREVNGSQYEATPLGRVRVSEALAHEIEGDVQQEADAITAAFVALDPDSQRTLLAAQMFAAAPEVYAEAAAPHFATAARQFAEGRRLDSGQFGNGPSRAHRARLAALDSLVAAAQTVDPTADRISVVRAMLRSAHPKVLAASLVAAAAPTPGAVVASAYAARRTEKRAPRSAPVALPNATSAAGATCCGTPVTDASRPCRCGWPR